MYSIASTTVRRSSACLRPRLPGALNTGSSRAHSSSVRSLGDDMPGTVPTVTTRAIGTHPVRPARPGRRATSTGVCVCRDLACSLYVRGKKVPGAASLRETLSLDASVDRLRRNLDQFVDRVI